MDSARRRLAALRGAPVGIFECDPDGEVVFVNDRWCEQTGVSHSDALGRGWLAAVHPDDAERVKRLWSDAIERAVECTTELRFVRADKTEIWIQLSTVPLRDEGGELAGFVGSTTDITPRVRAEAEKRMLRQRLDLGDRLASLGTLSAGIGHEINNPLAALIMSLDHLASRLEPLVERGSDAVKPVTPALVAEIEQIISDANASAERIGKIVRGVTSLAAPRDHESIREVRVQDAVERVLAMFGHELGSVRIVRDYRPAPRVLADPIGLSQIFLNLVVNALQALDSGRGDNQIRVATYLSETGEVVGEVEDTGSGVADAIAGRIFEPFFTTKPPGKGTGLGLAVTHEIVRGLGGRIEHHRGDLGGTLFRVTLPAAELKAERAEQGEDDKLRALIVEEEYGLLIALKRMIEPDFLVATERDAPTALARLRRGERFDAILSSLLLTELSTPRFHEEVAKIDPGQAARMMFLSGLPLGPEAAAFAAAQRKRLVPLSAGNRELQAFLRSAARANL
jgi:PAS domain S-box-containing protein